MQEFSTWPRWQSSTKVGLMTQLDPRSWAGIKTSRMYLRFLVLHSYSLIFPTRTLNISEHITSYSLLLFHFHMSSLQRFALVILIPLCEARTELNLCIQVAVNKFVFTSERKTSSCFYVSVSICLLHVALPSRNTHPRKQEKKPADLLIPVGLRSLIRVHIKHI